MRPNQPRRIGLTGGIGSGKSTVAGMLAQQGAVVIDVDAISRQLTAVGGAALPAIAEVFGSGYITPAGTLDRDAMRQLVFSVPADKKRLEAIIHPLVAAESQRQADAAGQAGASCLVFDIPLLVESGRWRRQLDLVMVIDCGEETQISRVMHRNGWPRATVLNVLAGQAGRAQRLAAADICIYNDLLPLNELDLLVRSVVARLQL